MIITPLARTWFSCSSISYTEGVSLFLRIQSAQKCSSSSVFPNEYRTRTTRASPQHRKPCAVSCRFDLFRPILTLRSPLNQYNLMDRFVVPPRDDSSMGVRGWIRRESNPWRSACVGGKYARGMGKESGGRIADRIENTVLVHANLPRMIRRPGVPPDPQILPKTQKS